MRWAVLSTLIAVVLMLACPPSRAGIIAEGPWCGLQLDHGAGMPRCDFKTLEECRLEMVAGARGICNINPRWEGPLDGRPVRHKRAKHRS